MVAVKLTMLVCSSSSTNVLMLSKSWRRKDKHSRKSTRSRHNKVENPQGTCCYRDWAKSFSREGRNAEPQLGVAKKRKRERYKDRVALIARGFKKGWGLPLLSNH